MKFKNIFSSGKMNKDLDERLVQKGEYRDALNLKVSNSTGSDVGSVENEMSNAVLTNLNMGTNAICIGSVADDANNMIYWFVRSETGSYICEYDVDNDSSEFVLLDTRTGKDNVLNFTKTNFIEGNILIDIDNNKKFLFFTDGINPPRRVEVNSAKLIDGNAFDKYDIDVIQKPPLYPPSLTLQSASNAENSIEERFIYFSYRYKYQHGEYSAMSPFSEPAFFPKTFSIDFTSGLNKSMVNNYGRVDVSFDTGAKNVTDVEIIFKESNSSTLYVAESFNKKDKNWSNSQTQTFTFDNSKIYKVLPEKELFRVYDNVPLKAKTQQLIGNRIVYGNYVENFNLVNANGENIKPNISVALSASAISSGPVKSVKSNKDYEIGLVYLDDYGRSTTVITSEGNSINVPLSSQKLQNELTITIDHLPPAFAKKYRIYVKQSKGDYESISPAVFYEEEETGYVYVQLNGNDKNKINQGDFLVVKADSRGVKTGLVETQVLEIKEQNVNFLEDSSYPAQGDPPIAQQPGLYAKFKPTGYSLSTSDYSRTEHTDYDDSSNGRSNPLVIGFTSSSVEGPFYYGTNGSVNDVTIGGTYSIAEEFARVRIEIDGINVDVNGNGTLITDTFQWSVDTLDNDATNTLSATNVIITPGTPISLAGSGLTIDFASAIGHTLGDRWMFNARPASVNNKYTSQRFSKAFSTFRSFTKADEEINLGTIINITYDEYNRGNQYVTHEFVSNQRYENIEEWYHESGAKATIGNDITEERIFFLRGTYGEVSSSISGDPNDDLLMVIRSNFTQESDLSKRVKINNIIVLLAKNSEDIINFETKPKNINSEIFYELPATYEINSQGYHDVPVGGTAQTDSNAATFTIPFFNCFSWGNCVESYKIKDDFNAKYFEPENRPSSNLKDYKQNNRTTSLTYSNVYDQTTKYNGLNEFNLSSVNYKDMDDFYGSVNKIVGRESDLVVFQENRVSKLLFNKNVLFNADGSGNVSASTDILGQVLPYLGEYGVTANPFSVVLWGGRVYFVDERRRVVCRLSQDGITQISDYGMIDWFNDNFKVTPYVIGGYDPVDRTYSISLRGSQEEWREDNVECEILYDSTDTDGDGTVDSIDNDDDGDGVLDDNDAFPLDPTEDTDTDGDGVGDNADTDDDGDGVLDVNDDLPLDETESVDTDGDGIGDNADTDDDGDGVLDIDEGDMDGDGIDDNDDADTDGDGILNVDDLDDDDDGIPDVSDPFPTDPREDTDTDGDGIGDNADTDDDGDGVLDVNDAFPLDDTESEDTDGDGVGDNADTDDDGDGVLDTNDAFPLDPTEDKDTDGDGIGDNSDPDDDGDGIADVDEVDTDGDGIRDDIDTDDDGDGVLDVNDDFPLDPTEDTDTDGDGIGDNTDTDDDGDGILDVDDEFPLDPTETNDTDGDGIGDDADTDDDGDGVLDVDDAFPLDPSETTDTDGDGTGDNADTDDDNDGILDVNDDFPLDPTETKDTDGDGIGDNADTDDDGDGVLDVDDAFPLDATESVDTDGDGIGNNADVDDDNDGELDPTDDFPLDPTETKDTDGDGIGDNADTDDDGDGVLDTEDADPLDPNVTKISPTITFNNQTVTYGDSNFVVNASSNSSGAITYSSSDTGVATISGDIVTIQGAGSTTVTANQVADGIYLSGSQTMTLTVSKASPTISFSNLSATYGDPDITLTAASNSTGAITYSSLDSSVSTISGNTLTIQGAGSDTVTASQVADSNYLAGSRSITLTVAKASPTIVFSDIISYENNPDFTLSPTSNSTGAFTFTSSDVSVATISGSTVTIVAQGTSTLTASQAADSNYLAGSQTALLTVNAASVDTDGDGTPDITDTDDDNDGVLDVNDAFPLDATESVDTDGDGIGNNADTDDDGDGVSDSQEAIDGTDPLNPDSDGDGIVDSVDANPLDSNNPTYVDRSGASRATSCIEPEKYMYINNVFEYNRISSSDSYNDNVLYETSDSALSIIPIASSAVTTDNTLYFQNTNKLVSSIDLTNAIKFSDAVNVSTSGLVLEDRYITKAKAVELGYTIGIIANRNSSYQVSAKSLTNQSINDIPDNAILVCYTNDLIGQLPNNEDSSVALCVPIGFREVNLLTKVNSHKILDTENNVHTLRYFEWEQDCNGDNWYEFIGTLTSTQQPGLYTNATQSLTYPQVTGYTGSLNNDVTFGDQYSIGAQTVSVSEGEDGFIIDQVASGVSQIGPLFRHYNFQQETIKMHSYYDSLEPITINIKNLDYGTTYNSTPSLTASALNGDISSGVSIDSNGNITVSSMGTTIYIGDLNHPQLSGSNQPLTSYDALGFSLTRTNTSTSQQAIAPYKAQFIALDTGGDKAWKIASTEAFSNQSPIYFYEVGTGTLTPLNRNITRGNLKSAPSTWVPLDQWTNYANDLVVTNEAGDGTAINSLLYGEGNDLYEHQYALAADTRTTTPGYSSTLRDMYIVPVRTIIDFTPYYGILIIQPQDGDTPSSQSFTTNIFFENYNINSISEPAIVKTLTINI